jgi:hypothetical protein
MEFENIGTGKTQRVFQLWSAFCVLTTSLFHRRIERLKDTSEFWLNLVLLSLLFLAFKYGSKAVKKAT